MLELFLVGSFGFWALIVFASIILLYCAENDRGGVATLTVIGSLCLLNWFGNVPVFSYLLHNPWIVIPGIIGYFALGTLWAVAKWFFYVRDQRSRYDALKTKFIADNRLQIGVNDPKESVIATSRTLIRTSTNKNNPDSNVGVVF